MSVIKFIVIKCKGPNLNNSVYIVIRESFILLCQCEKNASVAIKWYKMCFWNQKTAEQWLFMPCPSAVTPIKMISLLITWTDCRIYFTNQRRDFVVCVHDASKITNQALSQFSGVREQLWNNSLTWVQFKAGLNHTFNLNLDRVPWGIDIKVYLQHSTADVDGRRCLRCFSECFLLTSSLSSLVTS